MGRDVWLSSRMPPTKRTHQGPVLRGPEVFNYGDSHVMIFFWVSPAYLNELGSIWFVAWHGMTRNAFQYKACHRQTHENPKSNNISAPDKMNGWKEIFHSFWVLVPFSWRWGHLVTFSGSVNCWVEFLFLHSWFEMVRFVELVGLTWKA